VKGYKFTDISLDWLIIERSVQFKESISHVTQKPHGNTFVLPPFKDDEHEHIDSSSNESYNSEDSDDLETESVQSNAKSMHVYVDAEPE
jgi:hypothetical protein